MKLEELLKNFISQVLSEEKKKEKEENLLGEPDLSSEEDREEEGHHDEQNVSSAVAGYTLPLGASNSPTTLKQRGEIARSSFGGSEPGKKKKKKKKQKNAWLERENSRSSKPAIYLLL